MEETYMELNERLSSKSLINDDEEIMINNSADLTSVIEYRSKNDNIFISDIKDLKIVYKKENESVSEFKARVNAALSEEEIKRNIENGNGLFLDFNTMIGDSKKHGVLPVRNIALNSIYERARANCFTIANDCDGPDYQALSLETKINFLNECFKLYGGKAKILYRDRKITSVMSGQYYFISFEDIDRGLSVLKKDFPDLKFEEAKMSHEFFKETYSLNSEELNEDILLSLSGAGLEAEKVDVTITACTSDHGKVAATFYGKINIDDKSLLFGSPEIVKHAGNKSLKDIEDAASKLYSAFKENAEYIKVLPSIKIKNPDGCFRLICKEFHFPKKQSCAIADTLEGKKKVTAYELYFLLNELVFNLEKDGMDPIRVMTLQDEVARVLKINWKKFDKEFLWARGESAA